MTYSQKAYPPLEGEFPPPPEWLLWQGGSMAGQIRHHESLQKAKKGIYKWNKTFYNNWRVYRWDPDQQRYIEQYRGNKGDAPSDNELFRKRISKVDLTRVVPEEDIDAAISSILSTTRGA